MSGVQLIIPQTNVSTILEYVGEQKDVRLQIDVRILTQILQIQSAKHMACVLIVTVADIFLFQVRKELFLRWHLRFQKLAIVRHVIIWIYAFPE